MNWHLAFKLTLGFTIGLLVGKILIDWATSPRLISLGSLTTPFVDQKYLRDIYTNRTKIPDYVRGKNQYQWLLNTTDLDNGISYLGAHNRLRVAMDKLRRGQMLISSFAVHGACICCHVLVTAWRMPAWMMQDRGRKSISWAIRLTCCFTLYYPLRPADQGGNNRR